MQAINAGRVRGLKQTGVANKITEAALLKPYLGTGCHVCEEIEGVKRVEKGKGVMRIGA